jgi:hypothetical protein
LIHAQHFGPSSRISRIIIIKNKVFPHRNIKKEKTHDEDVLRQREHHQRAASRPGQPQQRGHQRAASRPSQPQQRGHQTSHQ